LTEKFCENCGQPFQCGLYGCWCGQVPLTVRQLGWLAERFQGCLCSACLERVGAGLLGLPALSPEQPATEELDTSSGGDE